MGCAVIGLILWIPLGIIFSLTKRYSGGGRKGGRRRR